MAEEVSSRLRRIWERVTARMSPPVFFGAAGLVVVFVLFGAVFTETASATFEAAQTLIVETMGWFYILVATGLLVFNIWLMASKYGTIRLGTPDSKPEFGYASWFAMMMSAGMGIGLVFFGAAEPLLHYANPPLASSNSDAALREAMRFTFYHWGLHPWAIYTAIALPLAYFHFRYDLPMAPRSLLYPLIGERIHGTAGHVVDILATVGTLFGVATSLGLGAMQINSGLAQIFGIGQGLWYQLILIAGITAIATISVVSGLHLGIQYLSRLNLILAAVVLVFVLVAGPTLFILELFISSLGSYLQNLPFMALWTDPTGRAEQWQRDWTLFYWSWWISWSPFVGVFVARISRGRTIREFVLAALLVPSLLGFFWFSVLGGASFNLQMQNADLISQVQDSTESALYLVLEEMPLALTVQILATLLVLTFFVTSSDSGSLVDDMITSGGHPNPAVSQRLFWALAEGAVAATLLVAGGLQALRQASLTVGLPMALFLVVAVFGLNRAVRRDYASEGIASRKALRGEEPPPNEGGDEGEGKDKDNKEKGEGESKSKDASGEKQ